MYFYILAKRKTTKNKKMSEQQIIERSFPQDNNTEILLFYSEQHAKQYVTSEKKEKLSEYFIFAITLNEIKEKMIAQRGGIKFHFVVTRANMIFDTKIDIYYYKIKAYQITELKHISYNTVDVTDKYLDVVDAINQQLSKQTQRIKMQNSADSASDLEGTSSSSTPVTNSNEDSNEDSNVFPIPMEKQPAKQTCTCVLM